MRKVALDFPKSILIETCNNCQGKCFFCPYDEIRRKEKTIFLDFKVITRLVDEIANHKFERLTLFNNNEPLLDNRIYDIIAYAHQKMPDIEITLSTNGRLLSQECLKKLKTSGLSTLYISIPSLKEEEYREMMSYDLSKIVKIIDGICNPEIIKMIRIAIPRTKYYDNDEFVSFFKLRNIDLCSWDVEYKEDWNIANKIKNIVDFSNYSGPCDRPMDQAVILADGDMVICCRDWNKDNIIGNVKDKTIYEIWKNQKMIDIQENIASFSYDKIAACKNCSLNYTCYKRLENKYEIH